MSQFEPRANIKFCANWENASEMLSAMQQVYGDTALKKSTVYGWFSRFKNGQETLEDDQRSGRPVTSRTEEMIEKVQQLIRSDRRMTIAELEQEVSQRLRDAVRRKRSDK
jgi:transposase